MRYVALLRGINVGGKNKIGMPLLKEAFEAAGMLGVRTYINSGNVIFDSDSDETEPLAQALRQSVAGAFGLDVPILLKDRPQILEIVRAIPAEWTNDSTMRCDVLFLWHAVDRPEIIGELPLNDAVEEARYVPGAAIWRVNRQDLNRSGLRKLVGTKLYRQMTIRNCNTTRKLGELVEQSASAKP